MANIRMHKPNQLTVAFWAEAKGAAKEARRVDRTSSFSFIVGDYFMRQKERGEMREN